MAEALQQSSLLEAVEQGKKFKENNRQLLGIGIL